MGAADDCERNQESGPVGEGHLNIIVHSFRPPKNHKNRPKRSHNYNILIDYSNEEATSQRLLTNSERSAISKLTNFDH